MNIASATILYGIPLVETGHDFSDELTEAMEYGKSGFYTQYSGYHDETPCAFGVRLGELDGHDAWTPLDLAALVVTDEVKARFQTLFDAQPASLQAELLAIRPPQLFLLWRSS
jgi:hypothetical protein